MKIVQKKFVHLLCCVKKDPTGNLVSKWLDGADQGALGQGTLKCIYYTILQFLLTCMSLQLNVPSKDLEGSTKIKSNRRSRKLESPRTIGEPHPKAWKACIQILMIAVCCWVHWRGEHLLQRCCWIITSEVPSLVVPLGGLGVLLLGCCTIFRIGLKVIWKIEESKRMKSWAKRYLKNWVNSDMNIGLKLVWK